MWWVTRGGWIPPVQLQPLPGKHLLLTLSLSQPLTVSLSFCQSIYLCQYISDYQQVSQIASQALSIFLRRPVSLYHYLSICQLFSVSLSQPLPVSVSVQAQEREESCQLSLATRVRDRLQLAHLTPSQVLLHLHSEALYCCTAVLLHCRVSLKAPLVMLKLLPPIFLFHLVQSFRYFFLKKISTFFSTSGNFLTIRDPTYGEKLEIFLQMWFWIAQIKRFWTLNATQKTAALYKAPFLKKIKKNGQKLAVFNKKSIFDYFQAVFHDSFKNGASQRAVVFCVAFSVPKRLI